MRWLIILLITTGCLGIEGDYNGDGRVNLQDYARAANGGWNERVILVIDRWLDMANSYVQFNGTSSKITVGTNAALQNGIGDITFSFWGKDIFGADKYILSKSVYPDSGYEIAYSAIGGGIAVNSFEGGSTVQATFPLANGITGWHHIAIVRHGAAITAYIDGVAVVVTGTVTAATFDTTADLLIGEDSRGGGLYLSGSLDDLQIYKAALTAGEVAEIYNGGLGKKYAALSTGRVASAAFNFDEGVGSYTLDAISGLLGTITGGVTWTSGGVPFSIDNSIEESIYYLLTNNVGVTGKTSTRIYPSIVPQSSALPCVTYQQISGVRDQELAIEAGFVTARFQINCWAATYAGARELSDVVRTALSRQSGTIQGKYIYDIQLEDENDMPQVDPESDVISRYGKRLDFQVFFNE